MQADYNRFAAAHGGKVDGWGAMVDPSDLDADPEASDG